MGTRNGLDRYDGCLFNEYNADLSDITALPGSNMLKIFEDPENHLWVLTDQGISRLNRSDDNFKTYFILPDSLENMPPAPLKDASLDWKGNQILLLNESSLNLLNIGSGEIRKLIVPDFLGLKSFSTLSTISYNGLTNTFYIFSENVLLQLNLENDSITSLDITGDRLLMQEGGIAGLVCGVNGDCWLYSKRHIWQLEDDGKLKRYTTGLNFQDDTIISISQTTADWLQITTASSVLSHNLQSGITLSLFEYSIPIHFDLNINKFLSTEAGIFWLATTKGLFQYNKHGFAFSGGDMSGLFSEETSIVSIAYDTGDKLWMGTNSGDILLLDNPGDPEKRKVLARGRIKAHINFIHSANRKDTILLASKTGLFQLSRKKTKIVVKELFSGSVDAMGNFKNDTVTIISGDSLVCLSFSGNFKTLHREIDALEGVPVLDLFRQSNYVFILQPHQLIKYSFTDSVSAVLSLTETGLNALPGNTCFLPSNSREIIVGTTMGMYIFYPQDFEVLPSFIDLELTNLSVSAIHQDTNQLLWFASHTGLFSLDRMDNRLVNYSFPDGLTFPESGLWEVENNSKGEICFAGKKRVVIFHPDSLQQNMTPPKIEIVNVEFISGRELQKKWLLELDTLQLKSRFTLLRFYCTVLDYWNPQMNNYQYSLSGVDKNDKWSDVSSNNIINIPKLKAGNYRLKVRGSNSRHVWNVESDEIIIQVIAPFWRSRITIIAYIALFFLSFYFSIYFTTRHLRKLNREYKEREQIAKKVEQQKEELTQKNKNITDSINYAKRIQTALMPSQRLFSKVFSDSFILHIPKDIVSGDFYWINEVDGRIYFAAVDRTKSYIHSIA